VSVEGIPCFLIKACCVAPTTIALRISPRIATSILKKKKIFKKIPRGNKGTFLNKLWRS